MGPIAEAQGLYSQDRDESGLTRKQREVRDLLLGGPDRPGMTQLQVAEALGISRQRVRQHVEALQRRGVEIPGAKPPPELARP